MNYAERLNLIKNGLPPTTYPKKILIIGAGIAGLVAADLLKRAGHTVTLLEAQHRVGGRIYTMREGLTAGLYGELGASHFPSSHLLTMAYLDRFGLETQLLPQFDRFAQSPQVDRQAFATEPSPENFQAEKPLLEDLLKATLNPFYELIQEQQEAAWEDITTHYDRFSVRDYLRHARWSAEDIDRLAALNGIEFYLDASFISFLRDQSIATQADMLYLPGGADALPNAFLPDLRGNIRFGASVVAIKNTVEDVSVVYNTLAGQFQETADYLILAVPFSALEQIEVTPPFSTRKRTAIEDCSYDSSVQLLLQYRDEFGEGIKNDRLISDFPFHNIQFLPQGQETGRRLLLLSRTWNSPNPVAEISKEFWLQQGIATLAALYPSSDRSLEAILYHRWDAADARGGRALPKPGSQSSHSPKVMPEGRVYFAGDYCSQLDQRWIQGAIEFALEAAKGIHEVRSANDLPSSVFPFTLSHYPPFPRGNAYRAEMYPAFQEALQAHFPGALPITDYMSKTYQCLSQYGFCDENTMAMVSSCRDEIADTLFVEVMRHWGKTFNCCSLAGFIMMGKTGLAAAVDHTPITNGTRRFIFYAMPHIAISEEGELGKIHRSGIEKISRACGALDTIVKELEFSSPKLEMDMQDIEQTIIRQKVLSTINYGDKPDLVEITKLAAQIIFNDVDQLLNTLDQSVFKYAVMTGIQIHGPMDTHWIYPQAFYVAGSDVQEGKEAIVLF
ncbi:FAD-dependent oxidoreductase [Leptolyngbya ohadii]|uniref:FAD-dependent oxidoreductase n=1 Tax=Leptolyngbya ohadii TaxID=1962290 RepID=UPI000B59D69B|nr:FAD-dependent oxidoreductase [Leptolyngbya ohadii]